ncbi:hypothetical protein [Streptomyces cacaoi]|uniref:Uncharacterized protein n=1 Tax=Streptomyces cacaoi TaxID=1898 RepID=A0A4Y3R790_STRCI|nr:hypothetical protein [Streptomyces cacaoi]NNG85933.1 hypothetical protein [Streptomyces cacaoi]GEB53491.1 hypothetical protein SCA03_60420 [Streptomyces cacaoi]
MSNLEDAMRRIEALEAELDELRTKVGNTEFLAGAADRDASELRAALRAHNQTLNALRETQLEQGQRLGTLEAKVGTLEAKVDDGFAKTAAGLQEIIRRLPAQA